MKNSLPSWLHIPYREDNIFSIVFVLVLTVPLLFSTFYPEGFETVKYPLFLIVNGIGGLILFFQKRIIINKALLVLLIIFWSLHLISAFFSLDVINSLVGLYGRYTGSIFFVTSWVTSILLISNAIGTEEARRVVLLRVIVFDAFLIAVYGLTQYFDIFYYASLDRPVRPIIPSTIGNQNFYAMFLVSAMPALWLLWMRCKTKWSKLYYSVAAVMILWALVMSGSRGGLLGFGVATAIFLLIAGLKRYPKQLYGLVLFTLVLFGLLYSGFYFGTRSDYSNGVSVNAEYTTQTRYVLWTDTVTVISKYPLFGTGAGNFFIAFEGIGNIVMSGNERFDDAHNFILNQAATVGLPSVLVLLAILGLVVMLAWHEDTKQINSRIWLVSSMAGILTAASFNPVSIPIWLLLSLMIAFGISYKAEYVTMKSYQRWIGVFISAGLVIIGVLFITSETLTVYGVRAYKQADNIMAQKWLKPAVILNPFNSSAQVNLIASRINLGENPEEITNDINKFLNQHSNSSGTYKTVADLNYKLFRTTNNEKYKNQISELYDEAIKIEPNFSSMYGYAAYTSFKIGDTKRALKLLDLQLSLPDNSQFPYYWLLRSQIMLQSGNRRQAIFALEKAYSQMTKEIALKVFLHELRTAPDITKLALPVYFPEVDI